MKIRQWIVAAVFAILVIPIVALTLVRPAIGALRQSRYVINEADLPAGEYGVLAIVDVAVIPMDSKRVIEGQTVIVEGERISEIGPVGRVQIPENATVINADGRYLIPGLSDMHVHLRETENNMLLYLANGVTTVRELGGTSRHLRWREEIRAGERPGPNLFVYSSKLASTERRDRAGLNREIRFQPLLQVINTFTPGATGLHAALGIPSVLIDDPNRADQIVARLQADGYDGLKTGSYLSAETHEALVASAMARAFPVDGHLPYSIDYEGFLGTGQPATAHVEELFKYLLDEYPDHYDLDGAADVGLYFDSLEAEAFPRLAEAAGDHGLTVTTTLVAMRAFAEQAYDLDEVLAQPEVEYLNPIQLDAWQPDRNRYVLDPNSSSREIAENWVTGYYRYQVRLAIALHQGGVRLMAGTDSVIRGVFPGFSLHDELAILVEGGLTPYEALRTATLHPAEFLGEADEFGTVEVGKRADLILLEANPLEEISATRRIAGVIVRGRWYTSGDLSSILRAVATAYD